MTSISRNYAIRDLAEAQEYLENEVLRTHLLELCEALLSLETDDAEAVMGYPDDLKLRSCVTLFREADPDCKVFQEVLEKFYGGQPDPRTLEILRNQAESKQPDQDSLKNLNKQAGSRQPGSNSLKTPARPSGSERRLP